MKKLSTTELGYFFGMQIPSKFLIEKLKLKPVDRTNQGIYWGDTKSIADAISKHFATLGNKSLVKKDKPINKSDMYTAMMFLESCENNGNPEHVDTFIWAAHYLIQRAVAYLINEARK